MSTPNCRTRVARDRRCRHRPACPSPAPISPISLPSCRARVARDRRTTSSHSARTSAFTAPASVASLGLATTAIDGCLSLRRSRQARWRSRSATRCSCSSRCRRRLACTRRLIRWHCAEHVLCVCTADRFGLNHFRHDVHRRRAALFPCSMAASNDVSPQGARTPGDYLPRTPCGSAPARSNCRPGGSGALLDLCPGRRQPPAAFSPKWISTPPQGGSHLGRR